MQTGVQLLIQPRDKDGTAYQVIDWFFIEITSIMLGNGSQYLNVTGDLEITSLILSYNLHCTDNYFGDNCATFCVAQDNAFGHFTCNEETGARICLPGYEVSI